MSEKNNADLPQTELIRPNWDAWSKVAKTGLWNAVMLASNIDPINWELDSHRDLIPEEVGTLLLMARSSIGAGILKTLPPYVGPLEEREVKLTDFAAWVNTVPHTLPPEFPWHPEAIALSNMNWPWGRHETHLLRKLAAAANKFWTQYLPDDPSTAPTNQQVIDWLKEQGVTARTAEIMATILRADGLPSGPRK